MPANTTSHSLETQVCPACGAPLPGGAPTHCRHCGLLVTPAPADSGGIVIKAGGSVHIGGRVVNGNLIEAKPGPGAAPAVSKAPAPEAAEAWWRRCLGLGKPKPPAR